MERLSHSRLAVFRACPRKYRHMYIAGRVPVLTSRALSVGAAWHVAMDAYWVGGLQDAVSALTRVAQDIEPEDVSMLIAMLSGYRLPDRPLELVAGEVEAEVKLVNPNTGRSSRTASLFGRVDKVVRDTATGEVWIVEHKTTSEEVIGYGPFWQRLIMDPQTLIYHVLVPEAVGVIYDVVRKPRVRLCGKDEADAARRGTGVHEAYTARVRVMMEADRASYYQVREVYKTPDEVAAGAADLWAHAQALHWHHTSGVWPRNASSCRTFYGDCPYLDVCTGRASIDDDNLFRDRGQATGGDDAGNCS